MKNLFVLFLVAFAFSCTEIPPIVDSGPPPPPPPGKQQRVVIIEEFTGVRCIGCPAGSALLQSIIDQDKEHTVGISLHASNFSVPYTESAYNFITQGGDDILAFLGDPIANPSAVVNRRLFEGTSSGAYQMLPADWAGSIAIARTEVPDINVDLTTTFDDATRQLDIEIVMTATEDLSAKDLAYTVMITESGIVDWQLTQDMGKIDDYVHNHALRATLTNSTGELITEDMTLGKEVTKTISYTLPAEAGWWVAENCEVIAFVHDKSGDSDEILQGAHAHVTE